MGWTIPSTCFPSEPWTRVPPEVEEGLTDPRAVYAERETEASRSADRWRARFDNLARLRMGVGLALLTAIVAYLIAPGAQMPLIAVSVALIVVFIVLVVRHASVRRKELWHQRAIRKRATWSRPLWPWQPVACVP